jgi:predicted unusual protein kinase regulating ubiquinone biosynthesis (AarF/ABC1/UbiB family)
MLPARLNRDWEYTKSQFEDLRKRLEQETDYALEAMYLQKARTLFREDDGIVVPQTFPQFSTSRVLTMERLHGVHLRQFICGNPSQEERNEIGRKIIRAWYRLMFAGQVIYADCHPGNFLVLDDGRLGLLDFGYMLPLEGEEWEQHRRLDRAVTTGRREDVIASQKEWCEIRDDEPDRLALIVEFAEWCWRPRYCRCEFDFGDEANFRRGIQLFTEMVRRRYSRARPNTPSIARCQFGIAGLLYLLKAKFNVSEIAEEEVQATGWDRSGYA